MTEPSPDQLAETLQQWLKIDSTSGRERAFLEELEETFTDDGWDVDRQPVEHDRWNLLVTDGTDPEVLLSTHVDTVPPTLPVRREGDTIRGRGACDTKGGLLAMVHAANNLRAEGVEGVGLLLVVGEEVDHCGAKAARELEIDPGRIILCEPTRSRVVRAQKGMLRATLRAEGVAGHSAYPDDGRSAIDPLLDALDNLRHHDWPTDDVLGPTTLNIGVVDGGVAANVFAPTASADILFRAVSPVDELFDDIRKQVGDEVSVDNIVSNDPVFFDPPEDVETCTVPFNTDAPYLGELGEVWLVGPGDIRCAHSEDERIQLDEIFAAIQLYESLTKRALHP